MKTQAPEAERLAMQLQELTDAHVEISDQMLALYKLTEFSSASLNPATAANRTVTEAEGLLEAKWTAFLTGGRQEPLTHSAGAGASSSSSGHVGPGEQLLLVDSAIRLSKERKPFAANDDISGCSILGVPVDADGTHFGMLVAASKPGQQFATTQVKLATAIANQLAVMLRLAAMHNEAVRRTLAERDHDIASTVAQAALKRPMPETPRLDLAAFNRPARAAGGDFYAASKTADGLYVAIGDVSGKGLPAALVMTTALSATYGAFERSPEGTTADVLDEVDHQMWPHLNETGMFITLAIAHLSPGTATLTISNAGHSPALRRSAGHLEHCPADGPPIGVLDRQGYGMNRWDFSGEDLLFLGSDGWTDQTKSDGEMFGEDRLAAELLAAGTSSSNLMTRLVDTVDHYANGDDQVDDLTALILQGA